MGIDVEGESMIRTPRHDVCLSLPGRLCHSSNAVYVFVSAVQTKRPLSIIKGRENQPITAKAINDALEIGSAEP